MKRLFILLLIFFAAVAISPLLINEKGYILIAMGDITIESTVVTAAIMLFLTFIALLLSLKVFKGSLNFGLTTWNKIAFANRRRALKNLKQGLSAYVLEDYAQAEQLLVKAAEPAQFEQMSYLMAAAAAEKQALPANTKHYLKLADSYSDTVKNSGLEAVIVKAKLLLAQELYPQARKLIDEYHKHIGHDARLLSLEIDLCIIEQRYQAAVDYLNSARKQKNITAETITAWEKLSFYGAFNQLITDKDNKALTDYWQKLPRKIKQIESALFSYCRVLAEQNIIEPINRLLLPALKKDASVEFLHQLRVLPISKPDELIHAVQKQLHQHPQSSKWLSCLGHLAYHGKQWAMSEKAFNSLFNLEIPDYDKQDLIVCAKVKSEQNDFQGANNLLLKTISTV